MDEAKRREAIRLAKILKAAAHALAKELQSDQPNQGVINRQSELIWVAEDKLQKVLGWGI